MQRGCESDSGSTAHHWSGSNRLILNSKYLAVQVFVATPIVPRMDELFAVDAEARRKG